VATDLDDDDKEMAALEAAMAAEDQAHGAGQVAGDEPATENAPAEGETTEQAAEPPVVETAPAPAADPDKPAEPAAVVAGVLAKDGKTVLPYGALKGARREAQTYRQRAERAEQELADLKAGKKPEADADALTPEELAEMATDFPQLGKLARIVAKVSSQQAAPTPQAAEPDDDADPVQEAIDAVPLLADWQAGDADKFAAAIAADNALRNSPKWKDQPLTARFAHVAKLVAAEYDIQTPAAAASPTPAPTNRKNPEAVIQAAARAAPNTLSDLKGGAPDPSRDSIDRMPAAQQMRRMEDMSDAEIDAYLRKVG
jgi:hypothetical protein